jgi:hypothetical protein
VVLREWVFDADLSDLARLISFKPRQGFLCQSKHIGRYLLAP